MAAGRPRRGHVPLQPFEICREGQEPALAGPLNVGGQLA
jgi:hypothetical protein